MTRIWIALIVALSLSPVAVSAAEEGADIERQIEQARRQLDEAARQLGELHRKQYALGTGKKKAMLGILLGEGAMPDAIELVGVTPGGGAEAAGLRAGDRIVKIDDLSLSDGGSPMRGLTGYMKDVAPGDDVAVVYERDGKRQTATITTQARAAHMLRMVEEKLGNLDLDLDLDIEELVEMADIQKEVWQYGSKSARRLMAVKGDLAEYFDVDEGVIVIEPPADSQLKAGDVLLRVADQEIDTMESALAALASIDEGASVEVKRRGRNKTLKVGAEEFASTGSAVETRVIRIKKPGPDDDGEVVVKVEVTD